MKLAIFIQILNMKRSRVTVTACSRLYSGCIGVEVLLIFKNKPRKTRYLHHMPMLAKTFWWISNTILIFRIANYTENFSACGQRKKSTKRKRISLAASGKVFQCRVLIFKFPGIPGEIKIPIRGSLFFWFREPIYLVVDCRVKYFPKF